MFLPTDHFCLSSSLDDYDSDDTASSFMDWSESKCEHNEGDEDMAVDSKHNGGEDLHESEEGHEAIEEYLKDQGLPINWDMAVGRYRRHPAILRANKQIYAEAVSILYSELQVCLKLDDLLIPGEELNDSLTMKGTIRPSVRAWRHNPLFGIGSEDENGKSLYLSGNKRLHGASYIR